jgi:serine protease AprX
MMKKVIEKLPRDPRCIDWRGVCGGLLLVALLLPVVALVPHGTSRAEPILLEMAAERPEDTVGVIVQMLGKDSSVDDLVAGLGGAVTKDLRIINAIAAELPAKAVPALARAAGVRWVSLDAPVVSAGKPPPKKDLAGLPLIYYLDTLGVRQVWDMGYRGQGIAVAVIDSGITRDHDFSKNRIVASEKFNPDSVAIHDGCGHGTHVAGIVGGNGTDSGGAYVGVAPMVDLTSLKISSNDGLAYESDTVDAMQWVLDHKDRYNIRVVNLSVNSTVEGSYHTSPLDAAAEILWFNGIVVVASAGNKGPDGGFNTVNAAPANDPFIITVGASDERGTPDRSGDTVAAFSAHGSSLDGFTKPDIIAPGTDIISVLAVTSAWHADYPDRVVTIGNQSQYFRLSGTSMAAPMVTGAVVLLLEDEPDLTPDQVKYRLTHESTTDSIGGYRYLDIYAAVTGTTTESANTGVEASQLLWTGDEPVMWDSVNWNSVNWNSVNWNSVNWNSAFWGK